MAVKRDKVDLALAKVRIAWEQGREIRAECGMEAQAGQIGELAERFGLNPESVRKRRQIAGPQGYTRRELEALLKLARRHNMPLAVSLLDKFTTVPKAQRGEIQRLAIENGWSRRRVQAEILQRQGRHGFKRGGRQPDIPDRLEDLLPDILSRCQFWPRLQKRLRNPPENKPNQVTWAGLPEEIRLAIQKAVIAMQQLEAAVGNALTPVATKKAGRRS